MTYHEHVWCYLVREWRHGRLRVATNGQTDNLDEAFRIANNSDRPSQVYDVLADEIIYKNY